MLQDRLGDDCLFSTSSQQHDITDSVKFVSIVHCRIVFHALLGMLPQSQHAVSSLWWHLGQQLANNCHNISRAPSLQIQRNWKCWFWCWFSQVSLAHSNSSHSLYVALGPTPASVEGLLVQRSGLSHNPASAHKRDWILLPVTFKQLKQVFRQDIKLKIMLVLTSSIV